MGNGSRRRFLLGQVGSAVMVSQASSSIGLERVGW